jgi:hypothetical protein
MRMYAFKRMHILDLEMCFRLKLFSLKKQDLEII